MVYLLALCAAVANAMTSILQRLGVEDAPQSDRLRLRLIGYAVRHKVWLAGFALMALSFVMQAVALHIGRLSEVQPILTTELLFLVLFLSVWFGFTVGWREWIGCAGAAAGLSGFLWFASPSGGDAHPPATTWAEVGGACAVVVAASVVLATRGPRWWRASMFGIGGAVSYAFAAACTKTVTGFMASDWVSMWWHWQTYGLAASGAIAVFLAQNAYHAGPIAASQSTLVLVDPLASILIGISLFGDDLHTRGARGPLEALSLLVLFGAGVLLSHSPLVTGLGGAGSSHDERLRSRLRRHHPPHSLGDAGVQSCG